MLYSRRMLYVAIGLVTLVSLFASIGSAAAAPQVLAQGAGTPAPSTSKLPCALPAPYAPANFTRSAHIDNQFLPLIPGTQYTLEGTNSAGPHTVVFTVTDLLKIIDGVVTVVLWDRDIQSGTLTEAELAFHAQDNAGNVWGLGEYPEEYVNGVFSGAPSTWITGIDRAQGGIAILGQPALNTPEYLQGYAPKIRFLDCARVFAQSLHVCVPVNCYEGVLETDETSPLASTTAHQQKFYAPGVGNIQITAIGDVEAETLKLTSLKHLDAAQLAVVRQAALALDEHGRATNGIYRRTAPAYACPPAPAGSSNPCAS